MIDLKSKEKDVKSHQLSVPFSFREWLRLNEYVRHSGMKKGALVRKIIVQYLDRQEGDGRS